MFLEKHFMYTYHEPAFLYGVLSSVIAFHFYIILYGQLHFADEVTKFKPSDCPKE